MSYYNGYARHSTTAVRVLISATEHPALNRTIEAPSDAPDAWLANAFLLSIGENPLPADDVDHFTLPDDYAPQPWHPYGRSPYDNEPSPSRTFSLPGVPHELEAQQLHTRTPEVGEAKVAIIEPDELLPDRASTTINHTSSIADATYASWQTSGASSSTREVNTELAAQYGVVQPRFDHSLVFELGHGAASDCLLIQLLRVLPPVRRLALRAHIREAGLLDQPSFTEPEVDALSEELRVLIDRIGPDGIEQSDDGWLPDDLLRDVARTIGWTSEVDFSPEPDTSPGAALRSRARSLRLIRRFKGRIVLTNLAKELRVHPAKFVDLLASYAVRGAPRSTYGGSADRSESRAIVALTLLSIADGTAPSRAEVPDVVARGVEVLARGLTDNGYYDTDGYWPGYLSSDALFSESNVAHTIKSTLDRLAPLGGPKSYGEFPPAVRHLARAALL